MHSLAERLLRTIRKQELMRAGERVAVAVSGGADSVALLLLLVELQVELGIVLSVAHVNHKLRGKESEDDEQFVAKLAEGYGLALESLAKSADRAQVAGIESAARRDRYRFFASLASAGKATTVATAHTLDDQAETVLMRLFRGAGVRGLAGILPRLALREGGRVRGEAIRPLLSFRREELRDYLRDRGQGWREDSSNRDVSFLRNRLRLRLMPLIAKEFGAPAVEHIADLAEIARAEEEAWVGQGIESTATANAMDVAHLLARSLAAQRRIVQAWIEAAVPNAKISFRLIEDVLALAHGSAGKKIDLPCASNDEGWAESDCTKWFVSRRRTELAIEPADIEARDYTYELPIPGKVDVPELGVSVEAVTTDVESAPESQRTRLLDAGWAGQSLVLRNWRAGDHYLPANTSTKKKVKDLLNKLHITGTEKKMWPVIEKDGQLVWMRRFTVPEQFGPRPGSRTGIWIRESPR